MCSFTGTRGEPACGGEGGGWSGGSVSQGCDPMVSTPGSYTSTPNSTFPQLCPPWRTDTYTQGEATSPHRQPIHPAEPSFLPSGSVAFTLPRSSRSALGDHFCPCITSSPSRPRLEAALQTGPRFVAKAQEVALGKDAAGWTPEGSRHHPTLGELEVLPARTPPWHPQRFHLLLRNVLAEPQGSWS